MAMAVIQLDVCVGQGWLKKGLKQGINPISVENKYNHKAILELIQ